LNSNQSIQRAIFAILGTAGAAATALGPRAMAADTTAGGTTSVGLEEVVVTAQRRTENLQDVPITIQATSGAQLQQLNITTVNELLKYTPNVSFSGNGPGTGNIFMRGLSSGGSGNQSQSTTAPFPNVALYLDDQSMQFPARNNDVYLVDMERVEVLEGPQGTLYGGGSQAGAIRYITNKPDLNKTSGNVNVGIGSTEGGGPNSNANVTFNLPLIDGKLALRATIFTDRRGGYIDNIPGIIQVPAVTTGTSPPQRPASAIATNAGITGQNMNTVNYMGARLSLAWAINDNWDLLLQHNTQNFEADGYFADYPIGPNPDFTPLARNQIIAFTPAYDKDQYWSQAWTLTGKIPDALGRFGDLHLVYTGSYMNRSIDQQADYSNYETSRHGSYYDCSGQGAGYSYFRSSKPTTCYAPVGNWHDIVDNTHQSHEVRLTTSDDNRLRLLVGAFRESFVIKDNMNFNYMGIPQCDATNLAISLAGGPDCVAATGPVAGYYARVPELRLNTNTAFGEDVRRGYDQTAFFASVDLDLIPKILTLTAGTRHYHYDEFEQGSEYFSATSSILNVPNGTQPVKGFGIELKKSESGFKSRANLTWHVTPDVLAYATWSQGFRPGGFNRTKVLLDGTIVLKAVAPFTAGGKDKQFYKPFGFDSDNLINNEIGIKSEWLQHRLQLNVSAYQMDWKNVQLPLFDPVHLGNTTFDVNGPTYQVKGLELQVIARVFEGLTLQGSSSWNRSKQTNAPCLISNVPAAKGNPTPLGQCVTQVNGIPYTNPYGVLGTTPAFSPALQYNVRARYDWNAGAYKAFATVGMNYTGAMRNQPASFPDGNDPAFNPPTTTLLKYTMPSYQTYDASIGISKDQWTAEITGNNLSNSNASTNTSSGQFIKSEVPLRPRVLTLQFGYSF
jgi:outer membrane receptor protein involved in Fe transport